MKIIGASEGTLSQKLLFGILGLGFVLIIWIFLTAGAQPILRPVILPSPLSVLRAFPEMFVENKLIQNIGFSIGLNLSGYIEAIVLTIPLGFLIGLVKYTRWGFQKQVDALRYVPLTALTGLFIVWFGIYTEMKIHFLAFGIIIYLLPIMIQRIDEVDDVYLKTVHTLGATGWQRLKTVYFPSVVSRLSDDIRVLTAISWTYIIVAESVNAGQGGLGSLIYSAGMRQVRSDKVFALLIIIMIIGVVQDKIFIRLDKELFPHKYQSKTSLKSSRIEKKGLLSVIQDYVVTAISWISFGLFTVMVLQEFIPVFGDSKPLAFVFGDSVRVIYLVYILLVIFLVWKWWSRRSDAEALAGLTKKQAA